MMKTVACCGFALAGLVLLAPGGAQARGSYARPAIDFSDVLLVQKKGGQFDGRWTINTTSQTCASKSGTNVLTVANGAIIGGDPYPAKGSVSASGTVRWTISALVDGTPLNFKGSFRGDRGSGSYERADRKCGGRFTATRG